jgi:hypothetical protein
MKISTRFLSGTFALAIIGIATTTSAFAYREDPSVQGPDYSAERHEAMENAFETGNYKAWSALMEGKGRVIQVVNADNFAQFAEAHKLAKEGKLEEAKAIRAELGLGLKDGSGKGQGQRGGGKGFGQKNGIGRYSN